MTRTGKGPIDPKPVLSLLLEPGSLVVTRSEMYKTHLHGIDAVGRDAFHISKSDEEEADESLSSSTIANRGMIKHEVCRRVLKEGGNLERGPKRISLTFRDVEKIFAPRFR